MLISKSLFIKLFVFILFIKASYEQQCIMGQNCPFNQGICSGDTCSCKEGYYSLLDNSKPFNNQIFCNYEQTSQYVPIILEMFLPSIGHFVVGKYWLGLIKLILLLSYCISFYLLYQKLEFPKLFSFLFKKIGLKIFTGTPFKIRNQKNYSLDIVIKQIILEISGVLISLLYFADLFAYKLGVYTDGNGVPFI